MNTKEYKLQQEYSSVPPVFYAKSEGFISTPTKNMTILGSKHQSTGDQIIQCGHCQMEAVKQSLAKLIDGTISIRRGHKEYTHITGDDFTLYCGRCGNEVYKRQG